MRIITLLILAAAITFACKPTDYLGGYNQVNQTQIELSSANFNVLGSFSGMETRKKNQINTKGDLGLVSAAKQNLLNNAKAAGVELTGSRTLVNVTVDVVDNAKRATCTITAEIIEFK